MADEKKPVQDETAEKSEEAKAPVSEICGNAEEGAAGSGPSRDSSSRRSAGIRRRAADGRG